MDRPWEKALKNFIYWHDLSRLNRNKLIQKHLLKQIIYSHPIEKKAVLLIRWQLERKELGYSLRS